MTNDAVREAFERFHGARKAKGVGRRERMFERLPDDTYADPSVQRHWWTWQNALEAQAAELAKCKTTMIAAAEEIHTHWDAHCDAEGHGPANLQRRLEEGIPAEYGYTAGRFAELMAERDAAIAELARVRAEPAIAIVTTSHDSGTIAAEGSVILQSRQQVPKPCKRSPR